MTALPADSYIARQTNFVTGIRVEIRQETQVIEGVRVMLTRETFGHIVVYALTQTTRERLFPVGTHATLVTKAPAASVRYGMRERPTLLLPGGYEAYAFPVEYRKLAPLEQLADAAE